MKQKYIYWAAMALVWSFGTYFGHMALPEYARSGFTPGSAFILMAVVFLGYVSPSIASWISKEVPQKAADRRMDVGEARGVVDYSHGDKYSADGLRMLELLIGHVRGEMTASLTSPESERRDFIVECSAVAERLAHLTRVKDPEGLSGALRQADDLLTKKFKRNLVVMN